VGATTFKQRNLNRFRKVYPGIRKSPITAYISDEQAAIEAATLTLSNEDTYTYTFINKYDSAPTVIATATGEFADVNVFVKSVSLVDAVISTSENYTGDIYIQVMWVGGC
jgi:hypothetical protein